MQERNMQEQKGPGGPGGPVSAEMPGVPGGPGISGGMGMPGGPGMPGVPGGPGMSGGPGMPGGLGMPGSPSMPGGPGGSGGGRPAPIREFIAEDKGNGIFEITAPPMRFKQYLVVGEEKALLIDTGFGMGSLKKVVETLTEKPVIVVNTHGHPDHGGGNYEFGAVYLHSADRELYAYKCADARLEEANHWPVEGEVQLQPYQPETISLEDGQVFDLGGRLVDVLHTPGHTAGSVSLFDRQTRSLFTGDNTNAHGVFVDNMSPGTVTEYRDSLRRMKALSPSVLYTGHMPGAVAPEQLDRLLACAQKVLDGEKGTFEEGRMSTGWKVESDGISFTYVEGKV